MDLPAIKDAFERVAKKQKVAAAKTSEAVDKLLQEVTLVKELIEANSAESSQQVDPRTALSELKARCLAFDANAEVGNAQKDLNSALSKYGKLLEKAFCSDVSKICCWPAEPDKGTLNQVITQHLYREGHFELGDLFANEAQVPETDAMKQPFLEMHGVMAQILNKNLEPALAWACMHREALAEYGSHDFEFKLHRLQFVHLLHREGQAAALQYARTNFKGFAERHMREIQRLMGCLLWARRLEASPYVDLLAPTHWDSLAAEFGRECCRMLGQPQEPPLAVTISAGAQAIPPLLKLVEVMEKTNKRKELQNYKQLPVEIELDNRFQFHSIFACPVSRDQSTEENPPMLMPCGHVLCKISIQKLAKGNTRPFKCPYCPAETTSTQCKRLYF